MHMNTPRAGLTVMQARGRVIRAESFCESLGHCEPEAGRPDTRRARSATPYNAVTPGVRCSAAGGWPSVNRTGMEGK